MGHVLLDRPHAGIELALESDPAGDSLALYLGGPKPIIHIDGHATGLLTTICDFWDQNIARTQFTAGVQMAFASDSANDTSAGTGARTLRAWLLKSDYTIVSEDITLAGTTKVNSVGTTYLSCLRMQVLTVGTVGGSNLGNIYCADTACTFASGIPATATMIAGKIATGYGVSRHGWYTVPLGYRALLLSHRYSTMDSTTTAKYGKGYLCYQPYGGSLSMLPMGQFGSPTSPEGFKPFRPKMFDEKTHIMFKGMISAAGDACVFAELLVVPR